MQEYATANTSALDAANYIIVLAQGDGLSIDPITLQKILFYAQCWTLNEGQRLFDDPIEAWKHGPVVRQVWKAYSGSRDLSLTEAPYFELSAGQMELIQGVWELLKRIHGTSLSKRIHDDPQSAWCRARHGIPDTAHSTNELALDDMAAEAKAMQDAVQSRLSDAWDDVARHQA